MANFINENLFLNLDKVSEVCLECKKMQKRNRRLWNKRAILKEISEKKNLFIISENHRKKVSYKYFSCALSHYNKECMKKCLYKPCDLEKPLEQYSFWTYCDYPNS